MVVCELCCPMGTWGFLSIIKNLSELILVTSGCLVAKRAFNALDITYYMRNTRPRSREFNDVTVGHFSVMVSC